MTTNLATTSSVRAALGVSEKEIRDDVLVEPIYSIRLTEDLLAIDADIITTFDTKLAIPEIDRTANEQRFVDLVQAYSAYNLANQCLGSISMFAPIAIKDSRSELNRNDDPYKALRVDIPAVLAVLKRQLKTVYALMNLTYTVPTTTSRILASAAPLGTDPVTG